MEAEPAPLKLFTMPSLGPVFIEEDEDGATHAEYMRALYVQTPAILTGHAIGIALMSAIFLAPAGGRRVVVWSGIATILWLLRALHWRRFINLPNAGREQLLAWRASWRALALGQGAMWAVAVWVFWGYGEPYRQLALILIVYSYCLGSVQLLSTHPKVFFAFLCIVLLPTIVRIAIDDTQPWNLQLAGLLVLLFGITWLMGRTYGGALWQAIELKRSTDLMADRLRIETREAEAARRTAEAASQAKTQFFAAASHDLRQPLHAMGLFAEALRQRSHDAEVTLLVNSINESVDALDGLFGELLDITRIDSGGVEVHPTPVRMREVFARLRLHFEPIAFEKGLQLSFRGEHHVALADPLLMERILRNLLSNAIRYTEDGGVLVSCRPRGGRLLLQVWDSGVGIAPSALPRIFDEFYQVQGSRPLQAHDRKGLGLGLSIVQRLARLMDTDVSVRSRVGHGTVFSFEIPAGRLRLASGTELHASTRPLGLTLHGRQFVVVEDEPAVREGLVILLKAWGARVQDFDSVAAVEAWLPASPERAPDLLILDYKLGNGTTGLQALAMLRARWLLQRVPAIVVTGNAVGSPEEEAALHDFHLLIKPVPPYRLRAMIAFELRSQAASE